MIWTFYLALQSLFMVVLAIIVIGHRRKKKISLGFGDDPLMERKVRIFGNHNEYTPMHLILLFAIENAGAPANLIHGLGIGFLLGRLIHAYGMGKKQSSGRVIGMIATFLVFIISASYLLSFPIFF